MPASLPASLAAQLRELAALSDTAFDSLVGGLRAIRAEIKQYRVFNDAGLDIPGLSDRGRSAKTTAFSLLLSRARSRSSIEQFISELGETLSSATGFDNPLLERLKTRATTILNIKSLELVAKAHDILLEHASTFSTSRVISDIRPIFGEEVEEQPIGAVLVHMLSIVYRNAGKPENLVVALDEKDIDRLIDILQRAKSKQKTLVSSLNKSNIPYVKVV